jgi:hypothetical protein
MQIPAVNVDGGLLLRHGFDDGGIRMTDAGDIVVHVDIASSIAVVQVNTFATNDFQRCVIEQFRAGPKSAVTPLL